MREIVLDTETTGLSPDNGDRIVEIGMIKIFPDGKEEVYEKRIVSSIYYDDERFTTNTNCTYILFIKKI